MEYAGYDPEFKLVGKTALITGAAQGIGRSIAELFAEKGASLVLIDLHEELHVVARELIGRGAAVLALTGDLTQSGEIDRFVGEAIRRFGRIDVLINNAGVVLLDKAESLSEEWWDQTMAINLKAPFMLAQAAGREMIKHKAGAIVNIASQASVIALDRHAAYCASKAGLVGLTRVLAVEWAPYNITVNAISPTVVLTELGKKAWAGDVGEAMKRKIPVGRFGQPEEIAAAALYLASDAARMITGTNLMIDGGYTAQ